MRNTQLHLGMSLIHIRTYGMRAIPYIHECVVYLVCIYVYALHAAVIKQFDRWNSVWKNTQSPSRLHHSSIQATFLALSCSRTNCVTHTHFTNMTIKSNFVKETKIFQNL